MSRKRFAPLAALMALLLVFLAACTGSAQNPGGTQAPATDAPEGTPALTEAPQESVYKYAFEKYQKDEPVMNINGKDVPWAEYFYWMNSLVSYLEQNYGEITDWDAACSENESMTNAEFVRLNTEDSLRQYYAVESNAADNGVSLSEEDEQTLEQMWQEDVANYGGGDEVMLQSYLDTLFLSRDIYDKLNRVSILYLNCYEQLYGVQGANLPEEDALAFAEENGYLQAKHILISTRDENNEALSDELKAEKLALAEDLLSRLNNAEDKATLFDELLAEYGEDPGMTSYPDGYCFPPGTMVTEFYDGTAALEPGAISGIVESMFGYHIIMRLPVRADSVIEYVSETASYDIRYYASASYYETTVDEWVNDATIKYSDKFADIGPAEIYSK